MALHPVHRSRWTACRRGSAAPPTMVLEENVRVLTCKWRLAVGPPGGVRLVAKLSRQEIEEQKKKQARHRDVLQFSTAFVQALLALGVARA